MNAMAAQHACSCQEVGTESGNVAEFVPKPGAPGGHGPRGNIEPFAMQCCGGTETYAKLYSYAEQFEALAAIRYKLPQVAHQRGH